MDRFRRAIAIFMLAFFSCQSVMACVDEHASSQAHDKAASIAHIDASGAGADLPPGHDHPGATDSFDSDCCHAHGHCHLLAFTGQAAQLAIAPPHGIASLSVALYLSLPGNPLLRPPAVV